MATLKVATLIHADCGHAVQVGERAYSHYTRAPGIIEPLDKWADPKDPWFNFRQDDGRAHLFNGQRVCCLQCAKRLGYPNPQ